MDTSRTCSLPDSSNPPAHTQEPLPGCRRDLRDPLASRWEDEDTNPEKTGAREGKKNDNEPSIGCLAESHVVVGGGCGVW